MTWSKSRYEGSDGSVNCCPSCSPCSSAARSHVWMSVRSSSSCHGSRGASLVFLGELPRTERGGHRRRHAPPARPWRDRDVLRTMVDLIALLFVDEVPDLLQDRRERRMLDDVHLFYAKPRGQRPGRT